MSCGIGSSWSSLHYGQPQRAVPPPRQILTLGILMLGTTASTVGHGRPDVRHDACYPGRPKLLTQSYELWDWLVTCSPRLG